MKIINSPYQEWSMITSCNCSTKVEIGVSDINRYYLWHPVYNDQDDSDNGNFINVYYYHCPVCQKPTRINSFDLNEEIKLFLNNFKESRKP